MKSDSINELCTTGWICTAFSENKIKSQSIVCAIGNYNKGKSYLLAYLSGKKLATGF